MFRERKLGGQMEGNKKLRKGINFFTYLVIHGKFKEKKNSFSFIWLTIKKKIKKNRRKTKSTIYLKWLSIY